MRYPCLFFVLLALAHPALARIELPQPDGSVLALNAPATRIITLSPHLAELAFAAGAGGQLIATVEFSNYPAEAGMIPRIGDAFRVDLERIVSLKPDLVLAWQTGNPRQAVERLASFGIPAWSIEIRAPGEIADIIEAIGKATGNGAAAATAAAALRDRLRRLAETYREAGVVDYFYQVDDKPLYTINGEHLISRSFGLCGGRNIFENEPGLAEQVSLESVIVADPAALLAPAGEQTPDPLAAWRRWPDMRAVRQNALILLPADKISRATPRMLDAVEIGCRLLHQLRAPQPEAE